MMCSPAYRQYPSFSTALSCVSYALISCWSGFRAQQDADMKRDCVLGAGGKPGLRNPSSPHMLMSQAWSVQSLLPPVPLVRSAEGSALVWPMWRRGGNELTSSAVECSTRIDIPSALLCHLPLMWSRYDWESRSMQSHTLQ